MKTPTTLTLLCSLVLILCACGGSTQRGTSTAPNAMPYGGGERVEVESVSLSSDSDDSSDEASADHGAPSYESQPSTTGAVEPISPPPSSPRPSGTMQPASPPMQTTAGGSQPFDRGGEATIDVGPRFDRLLSLQTDLGGVLALSTPNCPRAHDLEEAICELSEHICTIADDNPDARDARTRCRDGRDRCESAREQVSEGCGE